MSSGPMGAIADRAPIAPGVGEMDFRTGQTLEPTIHDLTFADAAEQEEQDRVKRMARAWAYYHGKHHRPLLRTDDGFDDNVVFNKARTVVDKGVAFLFGKPFRLFDGTEKADDTGAASGSADAAPAADGDEPKPVETTEKRASPITEAIEQLLQANRGMLTWQMLAMNGGVCGHAWLKLEPREGRPPRFVVLDPAGMRVVLHDDDIEKVIEYVQTWNGIDSATGKPYVRRQRTIDQNPAVDATGPWLIVDERADGDGPFVTIGSVAWAFEWPPIIGTQNLPCPNEFYGVSDLECDTLDLNDAINFTESNTQRILRLHGHPHGWSTGMQGQSVDLSPDTIVGLPEEAEVGFLEMKGDLSSAQSFGDRMSEAIHEQTRVPRITTGKLDNVGPLSGLAMNILYGPIVEKTEQKQLLYGWLIVEGVKRALELMTRKPASGFDLELEWPEVVPTNAKEEREVAILDNELGASKATLLERLGYDADSEAKKREGEASAGIDAAQRAFNEQGGEGSPYGNGNAPGSAGGDSGGTD